MPKKKEDQKRSAKQRLDHHERIMGLFVDRLNVLDGLNSKAPEIAKVPALERRVETLIDDVGEMMAWIDRGVWGRLWDRVKEVFRGDATPESTDSDA